VIFFISEDLFSFVFGQEWRVAGVYAKYLIPMFILKFVVSPLTNVHSVYEKQKLSLLLQLLMFFLSLISIAIVYFLHLSFIHFLILYSSFLSVFYVFRFIIILKISKK
jgi:O-antigen/teichoic acid export membrane protein